MLLLLALTKLALVLLIGHHIEYHSVWATDVAEYNTAEYVIQVVRLVLKSYSKTQDWYVLLSNNVLRFHQETVYNLISVYVLSALYIQIFFSVQFLFTVKSTHQKYDE